MNSLIIVDVEATCCDRDSVPREEMEIIEIGAVAVLDATGSFEGDFQAFVRPVRYPELTPFCKTLTNITQSDVDSAGDFPSVLEAFSSWMRPFDPAVFCSWGAYDRRQFEQDCAFHGVPYPFGPEHRNLKKEFSETMKTKKRFGLSGALDKVGLAFEGTLHRGIDDAKNIARLYARTIIP